MSAAVDSGGGAPRLSVVLVTADTFAALALTWAHLERQRRPGELEVLVVGPAEAAAGLPRRHPFHAATWVPVASVPSLDRARAAALPAISAPLAAFVEDHAFPEPDWAERIVAAHRGDPPPAVLGGAMVNANPASLASWANLLTAYGDWTATGGDGGVEGGVPRGGAVEALPGHNAAYDTAALRALAATAGPGELEGLFARGGGLHDALVAAGGLVLVPEARIAHVNPSRWRSTLALRLDAGRLYAAGRWRRRGWGRLRRLLYTAASPLIPAVRLLRHHRETAAGRRPARGLRQRLALAVGYTLDAVGQAVGYAAGAGASLERLDLFEVDRWRHLDRRDRRRFGVTAAGPPPASPRAGAGPPAGGGGSARPG